MASASESDKRSEANSDELREERKKLKYKGVRRRSWGKWVSEIREPKKKSRIWLGSYDSPHKAARAYDAAVLCLKGESAALNFPQFAHTLPRPAQSQPRDIQSAASKAGHSFDAKTTLLLSPHSSQCSSDPPEEEEIHDTEICRELENGETEQTDIMQSLMGQVCSWEESPNMLQNMAEGLLLTPPRMDYIYYQEEEEEEESLSLQPLYSLWNY